MVNPSTDQYVFPAGLPPTLQARVELTPIEDLILGVLRSKVPDFKFQSLIPDLDRVPFAQVRRLPGMGSYSGDGRFMDTGRFQINVFTKDPDGDQKGALISEGIRVVLREAWLEHWGNESLGYIVKLKLDSEPTRKSDWATSTGPVQYADLPTGHWRYESGYSIRIRKPSSRG